MVTCPRCGHGVPDGKLFCPDCGYELAKGDPHPAPEMKAEETAKAKRVLTPEQIKAEKNHSFAMAALVLAFIVPPAGLIMAFASRRRHDDACAKINEAAIGVSIFMIFAILVSIGSQYAIAIANFFNGTK